MYIRRQARKYDVTRDAFDGYTDARSEYLLLG
jgi:hypothetical protein